MKIINFTCVEKLHSLLDKSCSQTIRPAWTETKIPLMRSGGNVTRLDLKPARFNAGEEVKIFWNQRNKYNHFCCFCGKKSHIGDRKSDLNCITAGSFDKLLGTAEITEVFKIEMGKDKQGLMNGKNLDVYSILSANKGLLIAVNDIYERDGFSSAEEMFSWFDKKYDLSSPKEFYVYRWKYIL